MIELTSAIAESGAYLPTYAYDVRKSRCASDEFPALVFLYFWRLWWWGKCRDFQGIPGPIKNQNHLTGTETLQVDNQYAQTTSTRPTKASSLEEGSACLAWHRMSSIGEGSSVLETVGSLHGCCYVPAPPPFEDYSRASSTFFVLPMLVNHKCSRVQGSAVPSRVSLPILHTQAESGAYSRYSFRLPRRRLFIDTAIRHRRSPELIGSIAYRWRSLPRVRPHRARSPQGDSSNGCCLCRSPWTNQCVSLFPHPLELELTLMLV